MKPYPLCGLVSRNVVGWPGSYPVLLLPIFLRLHLVQLHRNRRHHSGSDIAAYHSYSDTGNGSFDLHKSSFLFVENLLLSAIQGSSEHRAYIRRTGRISIDHLLEVTGRQVPAYRQREEVNDLFGVRTQQVHPQDAVSSLFNQHLEAGMREGHAPRGVPVRGVLIVRGEMETLRSCCLLQQTHASQGWNRENDAGDACIVRPVMIALQQVF